MRQTMLTFALVLITNIAHAEGRWNKTDTGCLVWHAIANVLAGLTWSGLCEDGKADGQGTLTWSYVEDGTALSGHFEGTMQDGKLHGQGRFMSATGDVYEGGYHQGMRHGSGIYNWWMSGDRYEGEYRRGLRHGKGSYFWANGDLYEGAWRNGEKNGEGIFAGDNGDHYEGQWRNGVRHGYGVYVAANGTRVEGDFANGLPADPTKVVSAASLDD